MLYIVQPSDVSGGIDYQAVTSADQI